MPKDPHLLVSDELRVSIRSVLGVPDAFSKSMVLKAGPSAWTELLIMRGPYLSALIKKGRVRRTRHVGQVWYRTALCQSTRRACAGVTSVGRCIIMTRGTL